MDPKRLGCRQTPDDSRKDGTTRPSGGFFVFMPVYSLLPPSLRAEIGNARTGRAPITNPGGSVLTLIEGAPDPKWCAQVDALAFEMKMRGCGFVGAMETRDGMRELVLAGEPDPDANAGFLARCLAAMANR